MLPTDYEETIRDLNISCQRAYKAIKEKGIAHPHSRKMLVEFAAQSSSLDVNRPNSRRSPVSLGLLQNAGKFAQSLDSLTSLRLLNQMVDAAYANPHKAKRNIAEDILTNSFKTALSTLSSTDSFDYLKLAILFTKEAKTPLSQRTLISTLESFDFRTDDKNLIQAADALITIAAPFVRKLSNG